MTTLDDTRTEVIPPRRATEDDRPGRAPIRLTLTVLACVVVLLLVVGAVAEWIARAEVERRVADGFRAGLGAPESQHVDVGISGLVLPQLLGSTIAGVTVSSPDVHIGPYAMDVSMTVSDVPVDDAPGSAAMRVDSGEFLVGADQASAMLLPDGGTGAVRIGFRGGDMVLEGDLAAGSQSVPFSYAVTPSLDAGRMVMTPASLTLGDTTIAAQDAAARLGPEAAAKLSPTSVCLADELPGGIRLHELAVRDQHLVFVIDDSSRLNPRVTAPGTGCS